MDKDKAHIVTLEDGVETLKTIQSQIEHFNPHGGSGTRFKGGPQDVVQDSKYLERESTNSKHTSMLLQTRSVKLTHWSCLVLLGPTRNSTKHSRNIIKTLHLRLKLLKRQIA